MLSNDADFYANGLYNYLRPLVVIFVDEIVDRVKKIVCGASASKG